MNSSPFDPIETSPAAEPQSIQSGALEAQERAQIDMQIATAKRYPRTLSKVKSDMLSFATLDEETASACFYTLPRGGKSIQGPSVRLAEIALACWGNLRAGSRILAMVTTGATPHVLIQAVAHDLEKNTAITIEKRRRIVKKKSKDAIDEDDINLAANACSAVAFRDAVFKVVPQALIRPVFEAAKLVAVGEVKSLSVKRGKVIDRLKQMGVTEERILAVVEARTVDDIDQERLSILIGLGTSLKDGETTLEEAFPTKPASPGRPSFPPGPGAAEPPDDIPMDSPRAKGPSAPAAATTAPPAEAKRATTLPAVDSSTVPAAARGDDREPGSGVTANPAPPATDSGQGPVLSAAHQELDAFLAEHGVSFEALRAWVLSGNFEPGWDSYGSIGEVPAKSIARLLRSKTGLLQQLQARPAS